MEGVYVPRHENCPLCSFEIVQKSDTFCEGSIHNFTNLDRIIMGTIGFKIYGYGSGQIKLQNMAKAMKL
jgi:hypothetical protein